MGFHEQACNAKPREAAHVKREIRQIIYGSTDWSGQIIINHRSERWFIEQLIPPPTHPCCFYSDMMIAILLGHNSGRKTINFGTWTKTLLEIPWKTKRVSVSKTSQWNMWQQENHYFSMEESWRNPNNRHGIISNKNWSGAAMATHLAGTQTYRIICCTKASVLGFYHEKAIPSESKTIWTY